MKVAGTDDVLKTMAISPIRFLYPGHDCDAALPDAQPTPWASLGGSLFGVARRILCLAAYPGLADLLLRDT
jgi:hypothetical protein